MAPTAILEARRRRGVCGLELGRSVQRTGAGAYRALSKASVLTERAMSHIVSVIRAVYFLLYIRQGGYVYAFVCLSVSTTIQKVDDIF